MIQKWLFYLAVCLCSFSHAHGALGPAKKSQKYTLSVCALFKNESKFLKEWIEYHRLVGVEHFYLYNLNSTDRFDTVLAPYVKKGIVTLVPWSDFGRDSNDDERPYLWSLGMQIPAYENALRLYAVKETKWISFIGVDEFLVPAGTENLVEVLKKYDEYPGVKLTNDFFDAHRVNKLPPRKLVIEAVEMTRAPATNVQRQVAKMIFKPEACHGFTWPPYTVVFKKGETPVSLRKGELRLNHYLNRDIATFSGNAVKEKLRIDHRMLQHEELAELLDLNYEIEDQERHIHRFMNPLMLRMGYETRL